jgi:hypothetical protein
MQVKIIVKTPKGQAIATEKKIRNFLLGINKKRYIEIKTYCNDADDTIFWEVTADVRTILKIQRNVWTYDKLITGIFTHKLMNKVIVNKIPKEQQEQLKEMLLNQTSIEIIKEADEKEMTMLYPEKTTLWEKLGLKRRFD